MLIRASQDVNQKTLIDFQIDEVPCKHRDCIRINPAQKLFLSIGGKLVEYKEVSQTGPESPASTLFKAGVNACSSLIEKLRPPPTPYDVRNTSWYEKYFQTNVQQIQNCVDKASPSGSVKWREKPIGSFITWFSGAPGSDVVEIVLLGVAPPSNENVATIKEFQALDEDCQQAQREGKIPKDAQLIFSRVPEGLLAKRIESELAQGRCVIVASCHEDQRDVVYQTYKKLLATSSQKETLQFTALKRDAPRPLRAESRQWKMLVLYALLPMIPMFCLSVGLLIKKRRS